VSDFVQNIAARGAGLPVSLPIEPAPSARVTGSIEPATEETASGVLAEASAIVEPDPLSGGAETRRVAQEELQPRPEPLPEASPGEEVVEPSDGPRRIEPALVDLLPTLGRPDAGGAGPAEATPLRNIAPPPEEIESRPHPAVGDFAKMPPAGEVVPPALLDAAPAEPAPEQPEARTVIDKTEDGEEVGRPNPPTKRLEPRRQNQTPPALAAPTRTREQPSPVTSARGKRSGPPPVIEHRQEDPTPDTSTASVASLPRIAQAAPPQARAASAESTPPAEPTVRPRIPGAPAAPPAPPTELAPAAGATSVERAMGQPASRPLITESNAIRGPVVRDLATTPETVPAVMSRSIVPLRVLDARAGPVPRIDVRIGTVEVRAPEAQPMAEPPAPPSAGEGFDQYLAVRSYRR